MSLFKQPKPRPFHLETSFNRQRKERLKEVERRARLELGLDAADVKVSSDNHEDLRGAFLGATSHASRRHLRQNGSLIYTLSLPLLLLIIAVVFLCVLL